MVINVNSLNVELTKLNKLLEEYNNNNLGLYNEFAATSLYWVDKHSTHFSNDIHFEKLKIMKTYNEIKDFRDIYSYMIEEYQEIGNKININILGRESVLVKFNNYIDRLNKIIDLYNNLDYTFANYTIINLLNKHISILIDTKKKVSDLRVDIYNTFNNIENIEKNIAYKISKITIDYLEDVRIDGMCR